MVPIVPDMNHRMVYTELSQHLNSQDMRIKKGRKAVVEDRDREHHLYESLKNVASAEEALSRLAATFDRSSYSMFAGSKTNALVAKREKESQAAGVRLRQGILDSQKMHTTSQIQDLSLEAWKTSVSVSQSLGDSETTKAVVEMIHAAEQKHPSGKAGVSDKKRKVVDSDDEGSAAKGSSSKDSKAVEALRTSTSQTIRLADQYLATKRSIRFVKNALLVQSALNDSEHKESICCDCQACPQKTCSVNSIAVSSLCGHLICNNCFEKSKEQSGSCQAIGCKAPVQNYHLLRASKIAQINHRDDSESPLGAKISATMELLGKIKSRKDQAILFVRYEDQIARLEEACKQSSIRCTAVRDNNNAANLVTAFQKDMNLATRSTVIILNASNASAAGVNLTNANHVIFLSPLLTDSQYDYDASMAQAIGRVRRPGQKKDIHVYRMVALDTIDVDILEHRELRSNALTEIDAPPVPMPANHPPERERTQLIRDKTGVFKLMPKSWLLGGDGGLGLGVQGRVRVQGYEDWSSLVKFSKAYSEDD